GGGEKSIITMSEKSDILLINRDRDFLGAMAGFLQQAGYTVHTAMDMHRSLLALTSNPVGLIICDNILEDISGYDFLRFLKNDPIRDSIPFVLFVPINDQGRAFKAFELGAADFLVYPMELEDFVSRIAEILPPPAKATENQSEPEKNPDEPPSAPTPPLVPSLEERRNDDRTTPLPNLHIDLSRDGLVWIPGVIKNFSHSGIFIETSLLGKAGVSLKIKVPFPGEIVIAQGNIKHVEFDDFDRPVGIGVHLSEDPLWEKIYGFFESVISSSPGTKGQADHEKPASKPSGTILLPDLLLHTPDGAQPPSYEVRFYQSLTGKELDNYKVVSFVGSGTMGGVFKGLDSVLERLVALKVISYELSSQETFRELFIKEARFISKLDHPNIARIYSIGITNDILYYAMEFISGGTLADLIENGTNLNTLKGLDYLLTICQTLDFVWKKNIIHRDIKPENILINDKGVLKIVDFGVAKAVDVDGDGNMPEAIVGSPLYMAPDPIWGQPVDHRSDIYSLGATFYHAFCGHPPFDGPTPKEVLLKHMNDTLVPLKQRNPKISPHLSKIIEKMLAKNQKERYQNYQEIVNDLKAFRVKVLQAKKQKAGTGIPIASARQQ
ncbi:MAG: protein kinase, partial [Deltaproteobacteria bacterium]|nr:protein kinase [Deltaproteobacteria bacterium]